MARSFFNIKQGSIKQRLILFVMTICTLILILAAGLLTIWEINKHRTILMQNISTTAQIIGQNIQTSLAFGDSVDANNIISSLANDKSMLCAAVFEPDGEVFTQFSYDDRCQSDSPQEFLSGISFDSEDQVYRFGNDNFTLARRVEDANGLLGTIVLQSSYDDLNRHVNGIITGVIVITIGLLLFSYLLASIFQKYISRPILSLAEITGEIRNTHNYGLRADQKDFIELEKLSDGLNMMLDQIQANEQELMRLASYDTLTSLPNRSHFSNILYKSIKQAEREEGGLAILFIDLDRFKHVNDSLGHSAGDELLISVANRLVKTVRGQDNLCRQGGDEYIVLLQNETDAGKIAEIALRVVDEISKPFQIQGHQIVVTPSIGIVVYPQHGQSTEELLKNSDTAMYRVKNEGGCGYRFFSDDMNRAAEMRLSLESAIRYGIDENQFILHYQPQIDMQSGRICSFEALSRWQRSSKKLVMPMEYIPLAEETGLIMPIGNQALRDSLLYVKQLNQRFDLQLSIAVNISAHQFRQTNFYQSVIDLLAELEVDPQYLELELTEAVVMAHTEEAIGLMKKFRNSGIKLAIDDFGTGYSSLSYLKRFPFNTLKIDRMFIHDMEDRETNRKIVSSIIDLSHILNLSVVAEGVETENQARQLREMDCDIIQGYYFSKPLPTQEIEALLQENKTFL